MQQTRTLEIWVDTRIVGDLAYRNKRRFFQSLRGMLGAPEIAECGWS